MQMEETEANTTVFSILKSYNNFMSLSMEESSVQDVPQSPSGSLQTNYQQMMKLEEQAGQIHSGARLLQMEREKRQMELSHKRARIELEKAANLNANKFEREADRNQDLLKRIQQCQERETEVKNALQEQLKANRTCQKDMEALNKKLQEKETKLTEANETINALKGKISESQWNTMNQEMEMKKQQSQNQELAEQLDVLHKKWQEATQQIQILQAKEELMSKKEQKIQDLEQKLSMQEQDAIIVKNMKAELAQFPQMERELQQLREENAYLREMRENNGLLKEEVEGLQRKLERFEKVQTERVALELEKEKVQEKLSRWEKLDQNMGLEIRSPDDLSRHILGLQQRELILKEQNAAISSSARLLENARKQLQEELLKVQSQLLEEKKKREQQETMVKYLQKHMQLLIKARDGMRSILEFYDSELNPSEHSPQLSFRVREAEELVQKVEAHCTEMEGQLSQALEEAGNQKKRADMLEVELQMLKRQASTVEPSSFLAKEELDTLRLKIEELETERSRLEEENRSLEAKLEQATLQGYHDPSRTKILHFSMNPASLAKQQRQEQMGNLWEECERLRERIKVLEGGDGAGTSSSSSSILSGKLEGSINLQAHPEIAELKKQLESAELKNQRLREIFGTKIQEFRKVCYKLTGYHIDITIENQYRLTSIYAEHREDCLIFKTSRSSGAKMQLLETEFSQTVHDLIDLHLLQQDSIPAFLSAVTLELFSRQTVA
ncbi:mitotic spindle assembly checkpoint protein MAD1 isoform X2 [Ahaetulla prasina]|nr:mitotic spindle assembly checkpoint protein MAD1 isoform X2 [Ahaetulla prasina]XP_058013088.1 mitotic spindle assembly checkpoint protein MAD1 isoform X2 [Ahaetulla prasina]